MRRISLRQRIMIVVSVVLYKVWVAVLTFIQTHTTIAAPGFMMRQVGRFTGRRGLSYAQRSSGRTKIALLKRLERQLEKAEKSLKDMGLSGWPIPASELAAISFEQQYGEAAA